MTQPVGGRRRRSRRGEVQRRARARARAEAASRAPALLITAALVIGVVAAGVLVDRRTAGSTPTAATPVDLAPLAPPAAAGGSTWYCAGGTGSEGGASHRVHVLNPGDEPLEVTLTVVPGAPRGQAVAAAPAVDRFRVRPGESRTVVLSDVVDAPFLGAVVEVGPGETAVEHSVVAEADSGTAPCAASSSTTWHLAAGATTRDAAEQLLLFNPFPDDAVVDVTFATPDGLRSPPAFSGLIVPGRRVTAVDVGAVVSRHPNVATSVVARTGRLVVDRIQRFDGTDGPAGIDVTGAAPAAAEVWHFPQGVVAEGVSEVVTVYNPDDRQAEVDVEVGLDPTTDPGAPLVADPFGLSIPPQTFAQVVVQDDGRVPLDRGHRLTVRSQNGVAVVAERWVRVTSPAAGIGLAATLGSPVVSRRWLAATGATGGESGQGQLLVLTNPSIAEVARVAVSSPSAAGAGSLAGLGDVEIPPSGRVVLELDELLGEAPLTLVVQATLPVVAERVVVGDDQGRTQAILLASASSATVAPVDLGDAPAGPLPTVATTTSTTTSTTSTTTTTTSTTLAAPPAPPP